MPGKTNKKICGQPECPAPKGLCLERMDKKYYKCDFYFKNKDKPSYKCPACGNFSLLPSGAGKICSVCGENVGCCG